VAIQGKGFVLGEQVDPADARVEAVAQGEIDDPVDSPEGTAGLARSWVRG